jgi:hypothetical protein
MSVRRCRNDVANAEAVFVAALAQSYDRTQGLIDEARAAATPLRVGLLAALGGGALYLLRPKLGTLLRLPMLVGAVDSLVQHVGKRAAADAIQDASPPA